MGVIPTLKVRLPNVTFDDCLHIHGSDRSIELMACGVGHTKSDAVLFLPEEGVLFMSDLLFVECHPFFADGNPHKVVKILDRFIETDAKVFVPGHGPLGSPQDMRLLKKYIASCENIAQEMVQDDLEEEQVEEIAVPELFEAWEYKNFFTLNLRYFHQRLSNP